MADYDKAKYDAWRSLEVPRGVALALANDDAPLVAEDSLPAMVSALAVEDLATDADLPTTVAKVNALLDALRDAGLMETGAL